MSRYSKDDRPLVLPRRRELIEAAAAAKKRLHESLRSPSRSAKKTDASSSHGKIREEEAMNDELR